MADARIPRALLAHLPDDVASALMDIRQDAIRQVHARLVDAYAARLEQAMSSSDTVPSGDPHVLASMAKPGSRKQRVGYYLFGVVAGDGTGAGEGAEGVLPGSTVRLVRVDSGDGVDDLTALVSEIDVDEFAQLDVTGDTVELDESSALARAVRIHDTVIDTAFRAGPVIPVRFGTVLPDIASITGLVHRHADELRAELARLGEHVEWGVKVFTPSGDASEDGPDEQVSGTGSDYLRSRQRGRERAATRRSRLNDLVAQIDQRASELSTAEVVQPARPTADGAPVFCASYLLPLPDEQRFLGTLDELQETLSSQGIRIEKTGPWPPYHFVTVRLDEPLERLGEAS